MNNDNLLDTSLVGAIALKFGATAKLGTVRRHRDRLLSQHGFKRADMPPDKRLSSRYKEDERRLANARINRRAEQEMYGELAANDHANSAVHRWAREKGMDNRFDIPNKLRTRLHNAAFARGKELYMRRAI